MECTVSILIRIEDIHVVTFENYLRENIEVLNYEIVPDSEEMYQQDPHFKKMVKDLKAMKKVKDEYLMKNKHKYDKS